MEKMKTSYKIQLAVATLVCLITIIAAFIYNFVDDSYIYLWWMHKPIKYFIAAYLILQFYSPFYKISKYKHKWFFITPLVCIFIFTMMARGGDNFASRAMDNPLVDFILQSAISISFFLGFLLSYLQIKREGEGEEEERDFLL